MIAFGTTSNGYVFFQDLSKYSMWYTSCQNYWGDSLEFLLSHCLMQHTNHHVWWTRFKFTKKSLQSVATRVLVLKLQKAEEKFPSLKENKMSDVYMHAQKRTLFTYSWELHGQRNKILSAKLVLILIPYYFRFVRIAVQMLSIKCILWLFYH